MIVLGISLEMFWMWLKIKAKWFVGLIFAKFKNIWPFIGINKNI
jgi:hypothetical protein